MFRKKWHLEKLPCFQTFPVMSHSQIDVNYVAKLARLELTEAEVTEFQPQIEAILGYAESLSKLNISGIDSSAHAAPVFGRMREDIPGTSLSQEAMLQNAPDQAQGQIRVPKVVTDA